MDFSNAADMYVGSSPIKEAWMNGKLVWHRPDNIGLMLTGGQIIDYTQVMAEGKTYELSEVVGVTVQEAEVSFIIHPNYAKNGQTCYWSWGSPSLSESLFRTKLETEADDHITGYETRRRSSLILTEMAQAGAGQAMSTLSMLPTT